MLQDFLWRILSAYLDKEIRAAKIKGAICYVNTVAEARRIFLKCVVFRLALLFMLTGFVIVHVALFLYMPYSARCRAIVIFALGAFYLIVSGCVMLRMCSQKYWMRHTGASKLVDEVISKK